MAVYVVTWNLNRERNNYDYARAAFLRQLETYDNIQDPSLETVRWISTAEKAGVIAAFLAEKLDQNDALFVSEVNRGEHQGLLEEGTWEWIGARL